MQKFLPIILLGFVATAKAQDKQLISSYKFRVSKFRAIAVEGVQNGALVSNKNTTNLSNVDKSTGFNTQFTGGVQQWSSTHKLQQLVSIGLSTNINISKTNSGAVLPITNKARSGALQPSVFVNNRYYYLPKYFIELNGGLMVNALNEKFENGNVETINKTGNSNSFSIEVGAGYGRIETVSDMQTAIWLHRNLISENVLKENLSAAEMNLLAQAITAARNTRLLDNRRYFKNVLKLVDATLQKTGKVKTNDVNYFAIINDIVFFAGNTERQAGTRMSVTGFLGRSNNGAKDVKITTTSTRVDNSIVRNNNKVVQLAVVNEKPLNLKWQRFCNIRANVNFQNGDSESESIVNGVVITNSTGTGKTTATQATANFGYTYYPNTRTTVSAGVNGAVYNYFLKKPDYKSMSIGLGGNCKYFISYATTVQLEAGVGYNTAQQIMVMPNTNKKFDATVKAKLLLTL